MVPISLAAFPAYFALKAYTVTSAVVFGLFSVLVMALWYFIAEKHRTFQDRSLDITRGIEAHAIGRDRFRVISDLVSNRHENNAVKVKTLRKFLVGGTFAAWALLVAAVGLGLLVAPPS